MSPQADAAISRSLAGDGAAVAAGFSRDRENAAAFAETLSDFDIATSLHQCPDASSYITGHVWSVNGGMEM
jgi:hypothetical protein